MAFDPDIHHRHSIRLREYDYSSSGAYFITICAFQRECLFGEVVDGEMRLNEVGKIVREEWLNTAVMRPDVYLDVYVIMPNHFHTVIFVHDDIGAHSSAPLRRQSGSIGSIVAGFKSAATKRINALRDNPGCPVWQRNYYEHVIRNENDLATIRQYIADNPLKWDLDENNPANVHKL
jgi:REP element-mobilizing transposase RayT